MIIPNYPAPTLNSAFGVRKRFNEKGEYVECPLPAVKKIEKQAPKAHPLIRDI